MKPILFGAVLAVLWLLFGVPLAPLTAVLPVLAEPPVLAFAAGILARPYVARPRRWTS